MKIITQFTIALGLAASIHLAQGQHTPGGFGGPGEPPDGGKFPILPITKALDTNGDDELDANAIANAVSNRLLDRITVCLSREISVAENDRLHLKVNRKLAAGGRVTNGELVPVKSVCPMAKLN